MKKKIYLSLLVTGVALAGPVLQMNRAFVALTGLIPYLSNRDKFMEQKNSAVIKKGLDELQNSFASAKHDPILNEDLFAPSYKLINDNILDSQKSFNSGKKDYAYWRLKEITSHCLDCHTRLPPSYASSFQNGEMSIDEKKFDNLYNLGLAQLIVRRYVDAKLTMTRYIDEKFIKNDFQDLILPFKQILLIDTKLLKNPENFLTTINAYQDKKNLPEEIKIEFKGWIPRLKHWQKNPVLSKGINSDKELQAFINKELIPLRKSINQTEGTDVDMLIASGLLSNYFFLTQDSKLAPELIFWLGWTEKNLKRESFFGSGDLFFKLCIKRFPKSSTAKECLAEYKESIDFDFSGSSGTNIPEDVKAELEELTKLIKAK